MQQLLSASRRTARIRFDIWQLEYRMGDDYQEPIDIWTLHARTIDNTVADNHDSYLLENVGLVVDQWLSLLIY